jgi:2-phosphosulfolactate phosphatase
MATHPERAHTMSGRQVVRWELDGVSGAVVAIDVLRAFTTAAYAFGAGAEAIYLVSGIDEALAFKHTHPDAFAVGEDHGLRPDGFDFSNSPAALRQADLAGRTLVQRTSSGTRGVIDATGADRLWAASLVCASATAEAVTAAGIGPPTYVITGCFPDATETTGHDDRLTAALIERARLGEPLDTASTVAALHQTLEAKRVLSLGPEHGHPLDVELAAEVDVFDFAMEVTRDDKGLRLDRHH